MIRSRELALRCAKALEPYSLQGRRKTMRKALIEQYGKARSTAHKYRPSWLDQLSRCQSDEARRLLLGISKKEEIA